MTRPPKDPEQERAERILRDMRGLERRRPETRYWRWLPWLLVLAVVIAVALILLGNIEVFRLAWTRLAHPDSIPGAGFITPPGRFAGLTWPGQAAIL